MADVLIRSKNKGKKNLSREQVALIREFAAWLIDRLLGKRRSKNIRVEVVLDGKLFDSSETYGLSVWEDKHIKGREFSVEIDTTISFVMIMQTLAHEFVHIKQWATGAYYAIDDDAYVYIFEGKVHDTRTCDYWELPWEIEAYGRMVGLIVNWAKECGHEQEEWYKGPMIVY